MKTIWTIVLILSIHLVYGQKGNSFINLDTGEFQEWSPQTFAKNDVSKVTVYSYKINKRGKVKRDSTLLSSQEINKPLNKVSGIKSSTIIQTHGSSFLVWNKFHTYYSDKEQIIKQVDEPVNINRKKEYGFVSYNVDHNETEYEYDNQSRLTKETYKGIENHYSTYRKSKDTFHLLSIRRPIIDEYTYNSDNQKVLWYNTVDSTRYLKTKTYTPDTSSVKCYYCHPRHINAEWKYNSKKNLYEWTSYTYEGKIHTKRNYYYDNDNRLIKQIDSSGWYYTTPFLQSTTIFQYTDKGKIVTKVDSNNGVISASISKTVAYYDSADQVVKECYYSDTESCIEYSYAYENAKLISKTMLRNDKTINKIEYCYNNKGLLREWRSMRNGKLNELLRYNYE